MEALAGSQPLKSKAQGKVRATKRFYNGVGKVLVRELPKQARATAWLQSRDDHRRRSEAAKAGRPQTGYAFVLSLGSLTSPNNKLNSSLEPKSTELGGGRGSLPLMSMQLPNTNEAWGTLQRSSLHDSRLPEELAAELESGQSGHHKATRRGLVTVSGAKASIDYAQEPYVGDIRSDDLSLHTNNMRE